MVTICATPVGREPAMRGQAGNQPEFWLYPQGDRVSSETGVQRGRGSFIRTTLLDMLDLRFSAVDDGTMEFIRLPNGRRTVCSENGAPCRA